MNLRTVMQSPVYSCSPTDPLAEAARAMGAHNVGSLVVTGADGRLVGILTDRDLALGLGHGHGPADTVEALMSRRVVTIGEEAAVDEAAAAMDARGVRRLPVVDDEGQPVGIVCLDDLYYALTQETITLAGAVRAQGVPMA